MNNNSKLNLFFITESIRPTLTGIGFYARSFINTLLETNKSSFSYSFIDYKSTDYNSQHLLLLRNFFFKMKIYLWHNYLPLRLRFYKFNYIFNFNSIPHLIPYAQKEVYFVHDISLDLYPSTHPLLRFVVHKLLFKRSLNQAHIIVVNSKSTKNDLITYYNILPKKIFIVSYAYKKFVGPEKNPNFNINRPFILNINTLEPRKNIVRLLKAFEELKNSSSIPHKLVICGKKGWKYQNIFTYLNSMKHKNDVIMMGYISENEKKYLLKRADFFVYPSLYEGYGIPVVEAMSYRCPVICSKTSNLASLGKDCALLIDPKNTADLRKAMQQLIQDGNLKMQMRQNGIKKTNQKHMAIQYESQIRSLSHFLQIYD